MAERTTPTQATLRTLTFNPEPPDNLIILDATRPCDDTYACACAGCELDRQRAIRRGVRSSQPIPIRRKAA